MTRRAQRISDLAKDQRGAAAVEFAIVSGVFVTALIGIAYLGIMLFTNAALHWAVERSGDYTVAQASRKVPSVR
jgi:Flp pilus assembly protein TadG